MAITASEARRGLFPLIEKVNDDRAAIEITSKRGKCRAHVGRRVRGVAWDGVPVPLTGQCAALARCR